MKHLLEKPHFFATRHIYELFLEFASLEPGLYRDMKLTMAFDDQHILIHRDYIVRIHYSGYDDGDDGGYVTQTKALVVERIEDKTQPNTIVYHSEWVEDDDSMLREEKEQLQMDMPTYEQGDVILYEECVDALKAINMDLETRNA